MNVGSGCPGFLRSSVVFAAAYMVRDFLREGNEAAEVNEETVGRLTGILVSICVGFRCWRLSSKSPDTRYCINYTEASKLNPRKD
jgi:hypothetical protein